jgi:hypothetical protein
VIATEDGRTGFICADEDDMADRLELVTDLDRATCRERARARFGVTAWPRTTSPCTGEQWWRLRSPHVATNLV